MLTFLVRRLGEGVLTVFGLSLLVFLSLHLAPGDPAAIIAGNQATEEQLTIVRQRYGLNDPLPVQYWNWAGRILRGDFGISHFGERPIGPDLVQAFPISLSLALGGLSVAVLIGDSDRRAGGGAPGRHHRSGDHGARSRGDVHAGLLGVAVAHPLVFVAFRLAPVLRVGHVPALYLTGVLGEPGKLGTGGPHDALADG